MLPELTKAKEETIAKIAIVDVKQVEVAEKTEVV